MKYFLILIFLTIPINESVYSQQNGISIIDKTLIKDFPSVSGVLRMEGSLYISTDVTSLILLKIKKDSIVELLGYIDGKWFVQFKNNYGFLNELSINETEKIKSFKNEMIIENQEIEGWDKLLRTSESGMTLPNLLNRKDFHNIPDENLNSKKKKLKKINKDNIDIIKECFLLGKDNIHIISSISDQNSNSMNDSIFVDYKLLVNTNNCSVQDLKIVSEPSFEGFESLPFYMKTWSASDMTFKGLAYRFVVFQKTTLIPRKKGTIKIEPMKVELTVGIPTIEKDPSGKSEMIYITMTVSSKEESVYISEN